MRRLMLKAENQSYKLDRETGRLRIPIRGTEGVQLHLHLSEWHRSFLSDSAWALVLSPSSQASSSSSSGERLHRCTSRKGRSHSTRTRIRWMESCFLMRSWRRRAFRLVVFGAFSKPTSGDEGDWRRKRPKTGGSPVACWRGKTQGGEPRAPQVAPCLKTTCAVR